MVAAVVGLAAGATVTVAGGWRVGLLAGWMLAAAVFIGWVWATIARMDADATARHAVRENPGRKTMDFVVVVASVASLGAVALFLSGGSGGKDTQALLSVGSVALAWGSVHTLFTTRYARMYYVDHAGGIDFNEKEAPTYLDFALPRIHHRYDLPGVRYGPDTKVDPGGRATSRAAVVPVRCRHRRDNDQSHRRPGQIATVRSKAPPTPGARPALALAVFRR